jgi:DNA-binding CsgD family transcriptional regulator
VPDAGIAPRPRLLSILDRDARLTILHGPAGSGKTALLAQWAAHRSGVVRWAEAPRTVEELRGAAVGLLSADARHELSEPICLVIDGVDEPLDDHLLSVLVGTLQKNPRLRLIVSGRKTRAVERAARLARLQPSAILADELLARPEELEQIAASWGHPLPGGDMDAGPRAAARALELLDLTLGWLEPTRLLLGGSVPGRFDLDGAIRWMRHTLVEGGGLQGGTLEPACRLALLRELDPETVALVVDDSLGKARSADELVTELRDAGVLMLAEADPPGDSATSTGLRMPRLVRETLRSWLDSVDPQGAVAAHAVLAKAAFRRSPGRFAREILEHGHKGGSWDVLARFWTQHAVRAMAQYPNETRTAYSSVPPHVARKSTTLALAAFVSGWDAERGLSDRQSLLGYGHPVTPTPENLADYATVDELIEAVVIRMVQLRSHGTIDAAHELGIRTEFEVKRRQRAGAAPESPINSALFLGLRTLTSLLAGNDWATASELATRAALVSADSKVPFLAESVNGYRSLVDALGGWAAAGSSASSGAAADIARLMAAVDELDEDVARDVATRLWLRVRDDELWSYIAVAVGRYSLIFEAADDAAERLRELQWAHPAARRGAGADRIALESLSALFSLKAGFANLAQRAFDEAGSRSVWLTVGQAKLWLSTGQYVRAIHGAMAAASDESLGNRDRASLLFIAAASELELGAFELAGDFFRTARRIADSNGLLGTYTMLSRAHRDRLFELTEGSLDPARQARVDAVADVYPDGQTFVSLSGRERDVLQALADHESHKSVAEELFISVATARTHIQTLYSKLGVTGRIPAIGRAVELGLLDPKTAVSEDRSERRPQ